MRIMIMLLVGIGVALLLLGLALGGWREFHSPTPLWESLFAGIGLVAAGGWARQRIREWTQERRVERAYRSSSELAEELTPQLFGEHTPYVIEAADRLGQERDATAVPALIVVLERCVNAQRPGWRERAEAVAQALGKIGDRRALPLLYRLENVRGIGFIPAVRGAIASIEPQSSLLRAGSIDGLNQESLLRPVQENPTDEPALLLRAANGDV